MQNAGEKQVPQTTKINKPHQSLSIGDPSEVSLEFFPTHQCVGINGALWCLLNMFHLLGRPMAIAPMNHSDGLMDE